jgi:hypothetical protein
MGQLPGNYHQFRVYLSFAGYPRKVEKFQRFGIGEWSGNRFAPAGWFD